MSPCWLYYDTQPPLYKGIAVLGNYSQSTDPQQCRWQSKVTLTLQQVEGAGLCVGVVPVSSWAFCNQTHQLNPSSPGYLLPHKDTWWVCSNGLIPCIHTQVLNQTRGFCILVLLVTRLLYHTEIELLDIDTSSTPSCYKRELLTTLTLSVILQASLAGLGAGTAFLIS